MCGINLILRFENKDLTKDILKMNSTIAHRGPDDEGMFVENNSKYSLALGHLRLAIIDLSEKGHQPMGITRHKKIVYKDKNLSSAHQMIIFNGEIYNYIELREQLIIKGWKFESESDTEVLLKGYLQWKQKLLSKLYGIFAFIIYDKDKQILFGARDFPGIKPLFIHRTNQGISFSSELKYFVKNETLVYNPLKEAEFFQSKNIQGESMFDDVEAFPPGHYFHLSLKTKEFLSEEYFDITKEISEKKFSFNSVSRSCVDELDELLNKVVKDQMIADVEVGTICSGGVDSSLVTAIAKRYNPKLKIFSLDIEGDSEIQWARKVAKYLELKLIEVKFSKNDFIQDSPKIAYYNDLPIIHPNTVAIYHLSQIIRKNNVKVILSGEGADELFGGYTKYVNLMRILKMRKFMPKFDLSMLLMLENDKNLWHMVNNEVHPKDMYKMFLNMNAGRERLDKIWAKYSELERDKIAANVNSFIVKDLYYYLVPLLRRADRATMAAGIEGRVPYLDQRMINYGINLPLKHKLRFFAGGKILLKKVAERYLPKEIVWREKKGLPLPVQDWIEENPQTYFLRLWKQKMLS